MSANAPCLRFTWADAKKFEETAYRVRRADPLVMRKIGTLVGGERVVGAYVDPVWTFVFEVGPVSVAESLLFRTRIGLQATIEIVDAGRSAAAFPNRDRWQNGPFTGKLTELKRRGLGPDITKGDRWSLTWQAYESDMTAI